MLIETTVYTSPESGRTANVRMWKLGDVFEVCIEVENTAFVEDVFKSKAEAYAFLAKHWPSARKCADGIEAVDCIEVVEHCIGEIFEAVEDWIDKMLGANEPERA